MAVLERIARRVLWLATLIVHHANHTRPNPDGTKVGGHQASSASTVGVLTALYCHYLRGGDRVSIKPHASPAYHALQYLLGRLPREYLATLRAYGGLQAYPSRTKDPDPVDFSTGSVGLGAVAPAFAALVHQYARAHFGATTSRRFVALIGDAELDEGNVWEAVSEDALGHLGNVLWIVDLNRQSLDRVVPGIRAARWQSLFRDSGWQVLECKYGRGLQAAFARPGGTALRRRIDAMSNEEYQSLLRLDGALLRARLAEGAPPTRARDADAIRKALAPVPDAALPALIANLGGHDLAELCAALDAADAAEAPTVLFAYTIKGWGLPFAGDPLNHSALLSDAQMAALQAELGIPPGAEWDAFPPASEEARACSVAAARLAAEPEPPAPPLAPTLVPATLDQRPAAITSSQDAFGRLLPLLADLPQIGARVVTTSPDVAVSTSLGSWINKVGVYAASPMPDYHGEGPRLLRWQPGPRGQHVELGISEMNLFMLLGQLGRADELCGQPLLPIGTLYDPFICRGLDALIHGLYSGARFVVVGTPSGISLSTEGGAHQSTVTPSLGIELPGLMAYEPCFAREVEWTLLAALRACCEPERGRATYLRLSTKPIEQALLEPALARLGEDTLRAQVLAGGYRLLDWRTEAPGSGREYVVQLATTGAMVPEVVAAARLLHAEGVAANVLNLTSPGRIYRELTAARRRAVLDTTRLPTAGRLEALIPPEERAAPIVTVHDGASHALAFLGGAFGARVVALGVDQFGQSGSRAELYAHAGIDADSIVNAALLALDLQSGEPG